MTCKLPCVSALMWHYHQNIWAQSVCIMHCPSKYLLLFCMLLLDVYSGYHLSAKPVQSGMHDATETQYCGQGSGHHTLANAYLIFLKGFFPTTVRTWICPLFQLWHCQFWLTPMSQALHCNMTQVFHVPLSQQNGHITWLLTRHYQ